MQISFYIDHMVDIKKNVDHKNNYGQFTDPTSPPCMFYGLWEKAGEPWQNPDRTTQTPVEPANSTLLTTAPLPYLDNVQ